MKKMAGVAIGAIICLSIALAGCGGKQETLSEKAIKKSAAMSTAREKTKYLLSEGKACMEAKEWDDALAIAQYILEKVDSASADAKVLLAHAEREIVVRATNLVEQEKAGKKKRFGTFGE